MSWWELALLLLLLGAVWFVLDLRRRAQQTDYLEEIASQMSHSEASKLFNQYCEIAVDHLADPINSQFSNKEANEAINRAIACMNRIREIEGESHGPAFRAAFRTELVKRLKKASDAFSPYG